ncbi:MAG: hypothetical protein AB1465_04455 [Patescibacteria group bacterium]
MGNHKLFSFEDLLKKSWELFSRGMTLFLTIQFIVFGASFVIAFIFAGLVVLGTLIFPLAISALAIFKDNTNVQAASLLLALFASLVIGLAMILLFVGLFSLIILGQIALILAIDDSNKPPHQNFWCGGKNKALDYREYFKLAWQKFWPALGLFLLCGLIVGAGFIFFILPGVILGFFLIFVPYIYVLENKKITDCISESFRLVKNNFWDIAARYLIIYLIIVAVTMFSNFIPFMGWAVSIFIGIFTAIYVYLLYKDIKSANYKY